MSEHTSECQSTITLVTIRKNDFDEYEVPDGGDFYHTDDKQDAIDTAKVIYGPAVEIKFRRVR